MLFALHQSLKSSAGFFFFFLQLAFFKIRLYFEEQIETKHALYPSPITEVLRGLFFFYELDFILRNTLRFAVELIRR